MPPIHIVVVQGDEDVSIKVEDNGGGAPRSTMEQIWKFARSTSPDLEENTDFGKDFREARFVALDCHWREFMPVTLEAK